MSNDKLIDARINIISNLSRNVDLSSDMNYADKINKISDSLIQHLCQSNEAQIVAKIQKIVSTLNDKVDMLRKEAYNASYMNRCITLSCLANDIESMSNEIQKLLNNPI